MTILVSLLAFLSLGLWLIHPAGPILRGAWPAATKAQATPPASATGKTVPVVVQENLTPDGDYTLHLECEVTPATTTNVVTVEFAVTQGGQRWTRRVSQNSHGAKMKLKADFPEPELMSGFPQAEARVLP